MSVLPEENALMPRFHSPHDQFAGPPPEVMDEVDAAWERAQELIDDTYELQFEVDSILGRVRGRLRPPGGAPALHVSASTALGIACGEPLALRAPTLAA